MYYDDEARRFNFFSGLLLGAVLGTGIGLILGPAPIRSPIADAVGRARRVVERGAGRAARGKSGSAARRRPR